MIERRRVLVACCNGSAKIHKLVVFAVMKMMQDPRHTVTFIAPTWSPYVQNLHKTVNDFLAQGHDFLLLVDDDNPPLKNPLDLVELDLDIIGLPTPVWHSAVKGDRPFYYNALMNVYDDDGKFLGQKPLDSYPGFIGSGLKVCDAVGTGCVLIARRVLLKLMKLAKGKPFDTPFMREWNDKGEVILGNDFAFCKRAKAAGFQVWAHFDYTCQHFNELEIQETIRSFAEMGQVQPSSELAMKYKGA